MDLQRFESFDAYADAIFDADARVFLLGSRDGGWGIGHLDVDGIDVQHGIAAVPNLCEGVGWPSHLTLLLSQPSPSPTWLNGVPFNPGSLGVLAPGKGFVFRAAGPNEWITIAVPVCSALFAGGSAVAQTLRQWARVGDIVSADRLQLAALREAAFMSMAPACPPAIGRRLLELRLAHLIASRFPNRRGNGRRGSPMPLLCETALAVFRNHAHALDVDGLCKGLRISPRSLRDFSQACFGMAPGHYLRLRKLHAVYLDLATGADRRITVADCFLRHGYPYSTYAAARYRALFLETPSETRHRRGPQDPEC
ncbi:helix-turn-helix domain-containing protein [Achromobacter marplatensis]|uniref:helix-turn-helix domain-containing protein n=1 Tax=Achromobacter marplatensis TaxID=470868 RepID=UPI0039F719B0